MADEICEGVKMLLEAANKPINEEFEKEYAKNRNTRP